jgi:deoxyribonuclease V
VQPVLTHRWDLDDEEAGALQTQLADCIITDDLLPVHVNTVAGVDVAYEEGGTRAFAAVVVIDVVNGEPQQIVSAEARTRFPYSPGLLSFRELPVLAAAFDKLFVRPDLVICDGQGRAHPRRFGLACHIGLIYDLPTIGCAKTCLVGEADEPGSARGSVTQLVYEGEILGAVLRTRDGVKPLYVSPGHRVSLRTACDWVLALCSQYRIPEPIRMADQVVNKFKRQATSHVFKVESED